MDALDSVVRLPDVQRNKRKKQRTPEEQAAAVELMRYRAENGLDLWTGLPLKSSMVIEPETDMESA